MKTTNPTEFSEECLEMFDGIPHFLHSETCGGYCDYACNSIGFDQASFMSLDYATQEALNREAALYCKWDGEQGPSGDSPACEELPLKACAEKKGGG